MERVMRFIIDKRPADAQVIVATEDLFGLTDADATIVHVGKRANQRKRPLRPTAVWN
jgi:hypothetical protein